MAALQCDEHGLAGCRSVLFTGTQASHPPVGQPSSTVLHDEKGRASPPEPAPFSVFLVGCLVAPSRAGRWGRERVAGGNIKGAFRTTRPLAVGTHRRTGKSIVAPARRHTKGPRPQPGWVNASENTRVSSQTRWSVRGHRAYRDVQARKDRSRSPTDISHNFVFTPRRGGTAGLCPDDSLTACFGRHHHKIVDLLSLLCGALQLEKGGV